MANRSFVDGIGSHGNELMGIREVYKPNGAWAEDVLDNIERNSLCNGLMTSILSWECRYETNSLGVTLSKTCNSVRCDKVIYVYYSKLRTSLSKNGVCRDSTIERQWPLLTDWMTWVKKWVSGLWLLLGPGSSVGFAAGGSRHSSGDVAPLIRVVGSEIGHSSKTSHCPCSEASVAVTRLLPSQLRLPPACAMTQLYKPSYIITPGLAWLVCQLTADLSNT